MQVYVEKYLEILNKYNLTPPANEIVYFDNALGGARTKNLIGGITLAFDASESYSIYWDDSKTTVAELLYIIDCELSGDFEKGISGIIIDGELYTSFGEPLILAVAFAKSPTAKVVGDKVSIWGSSVWVRYLDTEEGRKQLYTECSTNYVKKSKAMH